MRIRSIKPEFWRSDDIDALSVFDCYSGPLPSQRVCDELIPTKYARGFVYFAFCGDELSYIGKTWHVKDRLDKHRRKAWWHLVTWLEVVGLDMNDFYETEIREGFLEALCIANLNPSRNISRPKHYMNRELTVTYGKD